MTCRTPVRSAPADASRTAARPRRAGGLLVLAVVLALLFPLGSRGVTVRSRFARRRPRRTPATSAPTRRRKALDELVDGGAVRHPGRRRSAWPRPVPAQLLGWVHDNAAALRISDLSMRYVDEGAPLEQPPSRLSSARTPGAASVELEYRYDGFRQGAGADGDQRRCSCPRRTASGSPPSATPTSRTPLWLADQLSVVRTPRDAAGGGRGLGRAVRRARGGPPYARCDACCRTGGAPCSWRSRARASSSTPRCRPSPGSTTTSRR